MSEPEDESSILVTVFPDRPGGYLPIGEYGSLIEELNALQRKCEGLIDKLALIARIATPDKEDVNEGQG